MYDVPIPVYDVGSYKFTGKERDSETGSDYFGARYYGSTMGRWVDYDVNGAGRTYQAQVVSPSINVVKSATFAPFGGLATMIEGQATGFAGITTINRYNQRLQPLFLSAASPSAPILSLCYDFHLGVAITDTDCPWPASTGDNGNVFQIKNKRDNNRSQNFLYDSLNRIQQAYTTGPNWGETFGPVATNPGVPPATPGIDTWGNLTNRSGVTGKSATELLNAAATTQNRLTGLGYDSAGNVTSNGSATYTYDAENRIVSTAGWTYTYDGDGHRVKKANGATYTLYWPDLGGNALAEWDSSGAQREYIFFNGKRVARWDTTVPTHNVHYYLSDHLGSTSIMASDTGTIQDESDYFPYGGEMAITNTDPNTYKFTGKERDAESCAAGTCLDNFGARYDASSLGRFMTPDWSAAPSTVPYANLADPQSLNLYSYVRNNPTSLYDPTGHCWRWATFFCNLGQRVDNLVHGEGFHTDAGVEDIAHRNNARRRQQEVNGTSRGASLGRRYGNFHRQWDRWWTAHDCEGSMGGCGLAPSLASLGVYTRLTRTLFRAVDRAEFEDIQKTGKFRGSPGGAESKYFYPTLDQAEKMGERMYGEDYGVVIGNFPESAVEGPFPVATEGDVFTVPNENLELARPAVEVPLDIPEVPE